MPAGGVFLFEQRSNSFNLHRFVVELLLYVINIMSGVDTKVLEDQPEIVTQLWLVLLYVLA